jgi:predicted nucleic acid-binding protein
MFLDTSGLLCLIHVRETQYENAVSSYAAARTPRLTHSYVLDEFVALAQARKLPREAALDFSQRLLDDADIETVWVDEARHRAALALLRARPDKSYTLCDAISFGLMRERGITEALTTDRHFEQEGLVRLLIP